VRLPAVVLEDQGAITGKTVGAVLAAVAAVLAHNGGANDLRATAVAEIHTVDLRHACLLLERGGGVMDRGHPPVREAQGKSTAF
jgi:hypothetical protein